MRKPDIVLAVPLSPGETERLDLDYSVHRLWEAADRTDFLAAVPRGTRVLVTTGAAGADASLMASLPDLALVAGYGVGFDRVDLDHARARGIRVTNTPGVLTDAVADMAVALLLAAMRRIPQGDRWVRDGSWAGAAMPLTTGLAGKTVGIVGLGRIGQAVARRVEPFGAVILYTGPAPKPGTTYGWRATPVDLARDADALIICAAGGAAIRHLVNRTVLDALGSAGYLVNVARGMLVDEAALIAALREGRIAGAGLDVFEDEPEIDPAFATIDTVVLQPHAGSGTRETRAAIGRLLRANLAAFFAGTPLPTPVL